VLPANAELSTFSATHRVNASNALVLIEESIPIPQALVSARVSFVSVYSPANSRAVLVHVNTPRARGLVLPGETLDLMGKFRNGQMTTDHLFVPAEDLGTPRRALKGVSAPWRFPWITP
jgi:Flp pilus assembly protein CpaB